MKLRVLSYNIRFGGHNREAALASVIRAANVDIVLLQEASDPRVVARIAELCEMPHQDARSNHSTAFLTKLPVSYHAWHQPYGARHAFLEIALEKPEMRCFGLHLSAWFSKWSERRRAAEIAALLEAIREHQDGFHLIAGDFNALAPGDLLQVKRMPRWIRGMIWLSGRDIARDTIQHMLDRNYLDAWRTLHPDNPGYSFPTWDPHVRLDYIFTPGQFGNVVQSCEVFVAPAEAKTASDHYPLLVELDTPA